MAVQGRGRAQAGGPGRAETVGQKHNIEAHLASAGLAGPVRCRAGQQQAGQELFSRTYICG